MEKKFKCWSNLEHSCSVILKCIATHVRIVLISSNLSMVLLLWFFPSLSYHYNLNFPISIWFFLSLSIVLLQCKVPHLNGHPSPNQLLMHSMVSTFPWGNSFLFRRDKKTVHHWRLANPPWTSLHRWRLGLRPFLMPYRIGWNEMTEPWNIGAAYITYWYLACKK